MWRIISGSVKKVHTAYAHTHLLTWRELLFGFALAIVMPCAYAAVPADENFDDNVPNTNSGYNNNFTIDGIRYTLVGLHTYDSQIVFNTPPLSGAGDGALLFDEDGQWGLSSVTIAAADGSAFRLVGISINALANGNVTITPNGGAAVSYASNGVFITQQNIDLSGNAGFQNITSFTIAGSELLLDIDDLNFESAVVADSTPPVVSSITKSGSPAANATSITYVVAFNESTSNVSTDDFQLTLTGSAAGTISGISGSGTSYNVTVNTISGTGAIRLDLKANTNIIDAAGNGNNTNGYVAAYTSGDVHSVDRDLPGVTSVDASTANGTYKVGDVISILVNFSESVTVNTAGGTPQLTLETGSTDRTVSYASGSGSTQLTFSYTVQAGDNSSDLDYVATNSLALNGGTIRDAANNNASLTLASPGAANSLGANKAIVVDGVVPTVSSVNSSTADGAYKVGDSIGIQINFSEAVTVTGTPQLTLETGNTDRAIDYASGTGSSALTFTYTVQAGDNSADLDYVGTNALALNGGTIADAAGNNATLTLATPGAANSLGANKALVVDAVAPSVSSITPTGLPAANAASMAFAVAFDESVNNISTDDFTLVTTGTASGSIASVSAASGAGVNVTINTITGTGTLKLNLNGSTNIVDDAGNGVAAYSSGTTHSVDRDTPAAPSTPDLDAASDTGASNTDNITSDNTPTFTGTAEANATVTLISSLSGTLGTTMADGSGNWSYTSGVIANGVHNITATATDAATNVSAASAALAVTIDGSVTVTTNADADADATFDDSLALDFEDGDGLSLREALHYVAAGGTVDFAVELSGTTITLGAPLTVPAGITLDTDALGIATISGSTFTLAGSLSVTNGSGDQLTLGSELSGTGALTKTGAGRLILTNTNNNSHSGDVTVTAGELWISSDSAFSTGTLTLNGGTLGNNMSSFNLDNPIVLGASGGGIQVLSAAETLTLSGNISGSGALTKTSGGNLTLSGTNSFSGGLSVSGTNGVTAANSNNLGSGAVTINPSSLLNLTGTAQTITNAIVLAGDATISNANAMTLGGVISGSGGLSKAGAGTLTLGATNTATGTVAVAAGGLALANGNALADSVAVSVSAGASLILPAGSETVGSVAGAGNLVLTGGTLTAGANNSSTSLSGVISGAGALTKAGTGTFTLSGTSSFSGATQVSAGTLLITGDLSSSSNVNVASGATLAGTGTTPTIVVADGGNLSPGNAGPGLLTVAGNLVLNSGANLLLDITGTTAATQYDQLTVAGAVSLAGANISATHSYVAANGDTYEVISNDGADAITGTFTDIAEGASFVASGNSSNLIVSYAGGSGNDLSLTNTLLPGAPTGVTAVAGNGSATVSFSAPSSNGGSAISSYTVTSTPGGLTATGASSPLTVNGLSNGVAYTFRVTATNATGTGTASAASNSVTPQSPNQAPVISGSPASTVLQGTAYNFVPTASDADNNQLTFSISNKPAWASFNTANGALTGTPSVTDVGISSGIIISVSDGTVSSALPAFSIEVTRANTAPQISGIPTTTVKQGQAYSFVPTASDTDNDSLSFSISNKPTWANFSSSTGVLSGTPQRSDVGTTQGIVISVSDGTLSASLPAFNLQVIAVNEAPQAENDSFTLPFSLSGTYALNVLANDTDPDNDSLSITFAKTSIGTVQVQNNQLLLTTPENFGGAISLSYSITDGEFNDSADVMLQIEGSNPDAPVVTVPDDLTVNATGLFTKVDVGVAMAIDRDGNRLAVALDKDSLLFSPGEHQLYWTATDAEGVSSTASQILRVQPLVSLSKAQTVTNNNEVAVDVILNGEAPSYPVEVGYSVGGSAAAGDHDLVAGTVQITSGLRASIHFNVFADLSNVTEKDVIITLNSGPNLTPNASTPVSITEANLAPTVQLTVMQQGVATSLVTPAGGPVTVKASVNDVNTGDTHSYSWQLPQNIDFTDDGDSISFAPDNLSGVQQVQLQVTDSSGAAVQASGYFRVIAALPVLDAEQDTDQDGIPDAQEGSGDTNRNGIPDYLDNMPSSNILPQQINTTNAFLMECDPGVLCRLGRFALAGQSGGAELFSNELQSVHSIPADTGFKAVGGIFDFAVTDLPARGQSVRIVIPQAAPIPAGGIYRKFSRGQWESFVVDSNNLVASATGATGYCPPPGDAQWQPGLIAGNWCVQLTIEDGGPNDDDGQVNSAVVDPGTVAVPVTDNIAPLAGDDTYSVQWNQTHQLNVLDNDADADGDTLTIQQASANFGTVVISDDGQSLWYTPPQDFIGHAVVNYNIADGNNGSANATANVTVYYNRPPSFTDSTASTDDKTAIEINVLANASDADGDTLNINSATAQQGTVAITAAQTLRYTPKAGFSGTDEISVQISDGRGGTAQAKVSVTVQAVPPVVTPPEKSSGGAFNPWLLALLALSVLRRSRYNRRR